MLDIFSNNYTQISENLGMLGINIPAAIIFAVVFLVGGITLILRAGVFIVHWIIKFLNIPAKKWRKEYINSQLSIYEDYLNKKNYSLYIDTKFTVTHPHDFLDPIELESREGGQKLIDFYLNKVFVSTNTYNRLYCILAGSGMGKTTFSIHLFVEYINKYKEKNLPFEIRLLSLTHLNIIEQIKSIDHKNKTILILDALDENQEAANDFETFKNKLEEVVEPFRFVLITCRTHFFKSSDEEPKESSLLNFTKEKGFQKYIKHYISPFTEEDISLYINKKYKKKRDRNKAQNIIKKCKTLMVRPLLLSYIDDLVESNLKDESYTETQLYKIFIDKWIQREVNLLRTEDRREYMKKKLYAFSNDLALNLFENRKIRNGWHISRDEYEDFLREKSYSDIQYRFDSRSLINRNSIGQIKFAHKSFFEYFVALYKYNNPSFKIPKEGMDMARRFYHSMVMDDINKYSAEQCFTIENPMVDTSIFKQEHVLKIYKTTYDYNRIFKLYEEGYCDASLNELHIQAELIDINFINSIANYNIRSIHVKEYAFTDLSPLLCIPSLSYINIESVNDNPLPESFVDKARNKGLSIVCGDDVYTISSDPDAYLPISLRLLKLRSIQRANLIRIINDGKNNNSIYFK